MSLARESGLYLEAAKGGSPLAAADNSHTTPMPPRPPDEPSTIDLVVGGRIGPAEGAALCERVGVLLDGSHACLVVCDVEALTHADLGTVDTLARLQLTARRFGSQVWLRHASLDLQEMLALVGLGDVVPCSAGLRVEAERQAKQREEPRGVEEEGDPADPVG